MKNLLVSIIFLILMSSTCKKKEDCHSYINFINQAEKDIIFGLRFTDIEGNCRLDGKKVMKNEKFNFRPYNSCIEENLNRNAILDIYIIDGDKYNEPGVFYDCDSIDSRNEVLMLYNLTLDDLKEKNFTITYP